MRDDFSAEWKRAELKRSNSKKLAGSQDKAAHVLSLVLKDRTLTFEANEVQASVCVDNHCVIEYYANVTPVYLYFFFEGRLDWSV